MRKVILTPLALALLAGCSQQHPVTPAAPGPRVTVSTVTVASQEWPELYEATGTVRALATANLAAKWMGYVRGVQVQVGDRVKEGELLISLDTNDLDAGSGRATAAREEIRSGIPEADSAVQAAKASLDLAQATWRRMNELYGKKSISEQEFDEVSAKVKASQAALDMARARRAQIDSSLGRAEQDVRAAAVTRTYAEIRAPFAGVVTAKAVEPGTLAMPGTPLLTIERDRYRLETNMDESRLAAVRVGHPVTVTLDGLSRTFDLRIDAIDPAVDAATRTYIAKIDLPALHEIRGGIFGRASLRLGSRTRVTVPAAAIRERGQLQSVFVAEVESARLRLVTVGAKNGNDAEVLSGLSLGERVIYPVPMSLADGDRIEVKP